MPAHLTRAAVLWGAIACVALGAAGGPEPKDTAAKALKLLAAAPCANPVVGLACSADGKLLACALNDQPACLLDPAIGKEIRRFPSAGPVPSQIVFLAGGQALLTASVNASHINTRQIENGDLQASLQIPYDGSAALTVAADGSRLASAGCDGSVWTCVLAGKSTPVRVNAAQALDVALSPDGEVLATAHKDRTVRLWHSATGRPQRVLRGHEGWVRRVLFSPDGQLLASAGEDRTLIFWEMATGKPIARHGPLSSSVISLAFAPDGCIVAAGCRRGTLHLWDFVSGKELFGLGVHRGEVAAVVFTPDGGTLITGGRDQVVRLWSLSKPPLADGNTVLSAAALQRLWKQLSDQDAARACTAIREFIAGPRQSIPFLGERMRAKGAAQAPTISQLIADLDSDRFAVRERATETLLRMRRGPEAKLKKALHGPLSLEARRRIQSILSRSSAPVPLTPESLRALRAVQVLEKIGTMEARAMLAELSAAPADVWAAHAADAALERLDRRLRLAAKNSGK